MKILAISGSLRAQSTNTRLLQALASAVPGVTLYEELALIPPFNPDLEGIADTDAVARLRELIKHSDAVVFSTPEYAHGIPGSLKNALDWIVGSGELSGKRVALVNASSRGSYAQAALKEVLRTMDARVMDEAELTVEMRGGEEPRPDLLAQVIRRIAER